jgi:hypothetical protein
LAELNTGYFGKNVNAYRRHSNLIDDLFIGEGLGGNVVFFDRDPKLPEGRDYPRGVFRRIVYSHIEILCVTRLPVLHNRKAADDQILDVKFV